MQEKSAESIVPAQVPGKKNIESWFERAGKARTVVTASTNIRLMTGKQQEIGLTNSKGAGQGEAPEALNKSVANVMVKDARESLKSETLMEEVVERDNLCRALHKVIANKGAPGIDGMTVEQLPKYLKETWLNIKEQLLTTKYRPKPVRRVEIPKPDGGIRRLGIPTVLDRLIQQAILQVLQPKYDPTFSPNSYGFRPKRNARQAVAKAQEHIRDGYSWVVDLDLEKFFDTVNHDRLMLRMSRDITDKRVLKLIRKFLQAGVMEGGLVSPSDEGTPQGGPLSPLLSNIVLDELDQELTRRGHRFVRYADDQNIYVKSETAGRRVFATISKFITEQLKLKVNESKSAVARPWKRKILGFSFVPKDKRRKVAPKAIKRFKDKVKIIASRTGGKNLKQVIVRLKPYIQGWKGYFGFAETKQDFKELDSWVRRKLRCLVWKQWQSSGTRYRELRRRGIRTYTAWVTVKSGKGPWRLSNSPAMIEAFGYKSFEALGLPSLFMVHS